MTFMTTDSETKETPYADWMLEYASNSTESDLLSLLFLTLATGYQQHGLLPVKHVLDIGCGDGARSRPLLEAMTSQNPEHIVEYIGIDSDSIPLARGRNRYAKASPAIQVEFIQHHCFETPLPIRKRQDLTIVSHSAYFAGEHLSRFIKQVTENLNENGLAIYLHDIHGNQSDINHLYGKYNGKVCDPHTSQKIEKVLLEQGVQFEAIEFTAITHFPPMTQDLWQKIGESPASPTPNEPSEGLVARNLLAFAAQCPLSALASRGTLAQFLAETREILARNHHKLRITNVGYLALAKNHELSFRNKLAQIAQAIREQLLIKQFINELPKACLHVHLDGTLLPELMFKLAKRNSLELPYQSVEETRAAYQFKNLSDFLALYFLGASVLRTEQDFYDLTYDYLKRAHQEGVAHLEMFVGPQTHTWKREVTLTLILDGTIRAMQDAQQRMGISSKIIIDFNRSYVSDPSLIGKPGWQRQAEIDAPIDALKTYQSVCHYLEKNPRQRAYIVGFGLDYAELGFPPIWFKKLFLQIKQDGYKTVAHAGEEGPADYIRQAVFNLEVSRIDHGNHIVDDPELMQFVAQQKIPLTMCPISNLSLAVVNDLKDHPLKRLLGNQVVVTVNPDDPGYFGGDTNQNYFSIARALQLEEAELYQLAKYSFEACFEDPIRIQTFIEKLNVYYASYLARKETLVAKYPGPASIRHFARLPSIASHAATLYGSPRGRVASAETVAASAPLASDFNVGI